MHQCSGKWVFNTARDYAQQVVQNVYGNAPHGSDDDLIAGMSKIIDDAIGSIIEEKPFQSEELIRRRDETAKLILKHDKTNVEYLAIAFNTLMLEFLQLQNTVGVGHTTRTMHDSKRKIFGIVKGFADHVAKNITDYKYTENEIVCKMGRIVADAIDCLIEQKPFRYDTLDTVIKELNACIVNDILSNRQKWAYSFATFLTWLKLRPSVATLYKSSPLQQSGPLRSTHDRAVGHRTTPPSGMNINDSSLVSPQQRGPLCPYCPTRWPSGSAFDNHTKTAHPEEFKRDALDCPLCYYSTVVKQSMEEHTRKEPCPICSAPLQKCEYVNHMRWHQSKKTNHVGSDAEPSAKRQRI